MFLSLEGHAIAGFRQHAKHAADTGPSLGMVRIGTAANRKQPRIQGMTGGGAGGCRREHPGQLHPLRRKPVEIRRPHLSVAGESKVTPGGVVGHDQEEVRELLGFGGQTGASGHDRNADHTGQKNPDRSS